MANLNELWEQISLAAGIIIPTIGAIIYKWKEIIAKFKKEKKHNKGDCEAISVLKTINKIVDSIQVKEDKEKKQKKN